MIPKNIKRVHILKAIEEIDKEGIPQGRKSKKFVLAYKRKYYPPKYVISLANKYANNVELNSSTFSGGQETNRFLTNLGFQILEILSSKVESVTLRKMDKKKKGKGRHDERCLECKRAIKAMLEKIYGQVKVNYQFQIGTKPDDYRNTPYYTNLKEIYSALQNYRGYNNFVKSHILPHCDFFVPDPGFIVEFDESQHFTACRKITLSKYPNNLELGFDRVKWIKLCEKINARDNDPPYRDEQRAWYDTLRDFLPIIKGLKPTVRLFSRDFQWCSLNPEIRSDVKRFETILRQEKQWININIKIREDLNPTLARIVITKDWSGNIDLARRVLEGVCKIWPMGRKVNFLITCGGFITYNWPSFIPYTDIGDNKFPNQNTLNLLVEEGRKNVELLLSDSLRQKLKEYAKYITIGVDTCKSKISRTQNYISEHHIELVFLIDLETGNYHWTGKSYPTANQEKGLVRINDLQTHFFNSEFGKVMILGCHDLTIFNPRSNATAKGWRKQVKKEFKELSKKEKPSIVLHHPHTTDSINIWAASWNGLRKLLPTIKEYASAGRYFNENKPCRSDLLNVLLKTKLGNTIDFII
jgi:hypothetical protein